ADFHGQLIPMLQSEKKEQPESISGIVNAFVELQQAIKGSNLPTDQKQEATQAVDTLKDQTDKKHKPDKDAIAEATKKVDQVSKLAGTVAAAWAKVKLFVDILFPG
ncbi:MAG: hypothetical protein O7G87_11245, partial [bacterium]|nr:hypothetical protein [bacterium]